MGNCLFGSLGEAEPEGLIRVITSDGGVMEFSAPISARNIIDEFPGHAIFRSHDPSCKPLFHCQELLPGKSYYLLPFKSKESSHGNGDQIVRQAHLRSNSNPSSVIVPYRMSCDLQGTLKRSHTDIFSRYNNSDHGFWKVKLAISQEQLLDILSEETRTQELIESVRTVAKCGNGMSTSVGFSDQWSLLSSRNASSHKDGFLFQL